MANNIVAVSEVEGRAAKVVVLNGPREERADDGGHRCPPAVRILALELHLGDGSARLRGLP